MLSRIIRLAAIFGCMAASFAAVRAEAHAILETSTPPINGTIKAGASDAELRYNSRIDRARSRLLLIRQDRSQAVMPISPDGPPDVIRCHLNLPAGHYTLRWQVLATDGHITRGDVSFTVTGP